MSDVPCNGCTLCCQSDMVRLLPGDDPALYKTEPQPFAPGQLMLAHKRHNGDCVYLDREKGCTIHSWAPQQCKRMDCRNIARAFTKKQVRKMGGPIDVWKRGWQLIRGERK